MAAARANLGSTSTAGHRGAARLPAPRASAWIGLIQAGALLAGFGQEAWAAGPDQSYTLFDPVPDADLRDMDTDRPNHVNTPHTIDAGHVQIETGLVDVARQWDGASSTSVTAGEVNIRLGLLPALEVNAAINSYTTGPGGNGVGDTTLGGKLNLYGDGGADAVWASGLALQPEVKLPTAGSARGNGHVEAVLNIPFQMNLPAGFHFGAELTPGALRNEKNTATVASNQQSAELDRVLFANVDVYVEIWSETLRGSRPQSSFDTGFTLPLGKNLMVDSGIFAGLTRASVSFEYVAGVSVRF